MLYFNMPANLPPEYFEVEKRFREARTPQEKVALLEELIATVPKHKGTDKLRAELRRKLSKLRQEAQKRRKSGRGDLYSVEKEGAAQVALVGLPNSGKSALLASLTNARPVVASYPMSTVMPIPGMMPYEDIQFQIVDLPPIGNESTDGWVSGILRVADMLLVVIDLSDAPQIQAELILEQLEKWRISIRRKGEKTLERKTKPLLLVANKSDLDTKEEGLKELAETYGELYPIVAVSAEQKTGLEELKRAIFENSDVIRVYTKEPGEEPDLSMPFVLPAGSTVLDLAEIIHKDFVKNLKYACIWGSSKFPGQRVQREYILHDRDIVELHVR
jgi:hypothetical protein